MAQGSGIVQADPLFVGLTRPPMLFGVSYTFAGLNGLIVMLGYIIFTSPKFILFGFFVHMVGYYLCAKEPLFIELFMIKQSKCNRSKNAATFGANSYDPF
jgi:type IV secretion system protein VirB3